MSKREFEALKSRSRDTQAALMNASRKQGKLTLDEVLGRQFYNINLSTRTSTKETIKINQLEPEESNDFVNEMVKEVDPEFLQPSTLSSDS